VLRRTNQVHCLRFALIYGVNDGLCLRTEAIEVVIAVAILHYNETLQRYAASRSCFTLYQRIKLLKRKSLYGNLGFKGTFWLASKLCNALVLPSL
ncbi:hypothetical protein PHMEG_00035261, partial [Phytophthora megakarya]